MRRQFLLGIATVGIGAKAVMKRSYSLASVLGLPFESGSDAQYPVLGAFANKVIQKYQKATCEQLWVKKGAQITAGTGSHPASALRSGEAGRIHRQSGSAHRQQNVRVRHDP
jgi:hypothetical protein